MRRSGFAGRRVRWIGFAALLLASVSACEGIISGHTVNSRDLAACWMWFDRAAKFPVEVEGIPTEVDLWLDETAVGMYEVCKR